MKKFLILRLCLIPIILETLTFYSCNRNSPMSNQSAIRKLNATDSLIRNIPQDLNNYFFKLYKQNLEKKLGLYSIENGFDSIQIRIWYQYSLSINRQLVVLKCQNSKWTGEFYDYKVFDLSYHNNTTNLNGYESVDSIHFNVVEKNPIWGWDDFINKLFKLEVLSIKDYSLIEGYELGTDGNGVFIEIATKNFYKIYTYPTPIVYKRKITEAGLIEEILSLIQTNFSFKQYKTI